MLRPSRLFLFLAALIVLPANPALSSENEMPHQAIVVVSPSWSDADAMLYRFENRAGTWSKVGKTVRAVIGEKGMGLGVGMPGAEAGAPVKKEGDRKAPAGIFSLLTAMGYGDGSSFRGSFPYERITEETRCVDDPGSAYYNTIVKEGRFPQAGAGLWKSSEQMLLADDRYKKLVVVGYNGPKPQPGSGSCIFMHIWRSPGSPTMGCTAMAEKDLDEILHWLRAEAHPILVQLPMPVYRERWRQLGLPAPELLADPAALVDAAGLIPGLVVDMRYATPDNFTGRRVYECNRCFLREATAGKLAKAQAELQKEGFGLRAWDCYRPLSVQKIFWALVPDPRYVADPAKGSKHNRGTAVDVTMVDAQGNGAAMPTPFDDFTARASRDNNDLPPEVLKNRKTLETAMKNAGFEPLPSEWWHFDDNDWQSYGILDINICR